MKLPICKWYVILFFVLVPGAAWSVLPSNIDSLKNELHNAKTDTHRLRILNIIAYDIRESNPQKAIEYGKEALVLAQKTGDKIAFGKANQRIGLGYHYAADYAKAIKYLLTALTIGEELKDQRLISTTLTNLGVVHMKQGNDSIAIQYYDRAYEINRSDGDIENMSIIHNNLGELYYRLGDYEKSLEQLKWALKFSDSMGVDNSIQLNNIGLLYATLGDNAMALEFHEKALSQRQENKDTFGIAMSYINLGDLNFRKRHKNTMQESVKFYHLAIPYASKANFLDGLLTIYYGLSETYKIMNVHDSAWHYRERHYALKDSLFNIEKSKQISELQTKYDTEKKEAQIELQNATIKSQTYQLYGLSIAGSALIIIGIFFFRQRMLIKEHARIELEQKFLRAQMNPHFISNALAAIKGAALELPPEVIGEYIYRFSKLMRLILEGTKVEFISLADDIHAITIYIKLQKLRFENDFDYNITVSDDIDPDLTFIPPMLTQPFVENAIEHGIRNMDEKGSISISYRFDGTNKLLIEITDNGRGMQQTPAGNAKGHKSSTIAITEARLKNLNKGKKQKIVMQIQDLSETENTKGTKVVFQIPQ